VNRKLHAVTILLAAFAVSPNLCAQTAAQSNPPKQPPKKSESFLQKVLRVSGIAASPATLKGPGDEVESGLVWLVDVASKKARRLTTDGGYRSPVFPPGDKDIFALRGTDVVRLSRSGGNAQKLYSIRGISKLVGFSQDDADKVLVLVADGTGNATVGLLSVNTGKIEAVRYDPASSEDRQVFEQLQGWNRVYGSKKVYVERQSKQSLAGPIEWTDVFLKEGVNKPLNLSECDEVNCGQPSLSQDGKLVAFVRAEH
jgi:hypothetical protein